MKNQLLKWTNEGKELVVELELSDTCKVLSVTDAPEVNKGKKPQIEAPQQKQETRKVSRKQKKPCGSCASSKLKRLIKGGAGLLKAELGIDAADESTIMNRRSICESCELYEFGVCDETKGGCGCFCAAKVKLKTEQCPKGKW